MKSLFVLRVFFLTFAVVGLFGMGFGQDPQPSASPTTAAAADQPKPDTIKVIRGDGVETAPGDGSRNSERYLIGFEDTLQIDVYRHPELSSVVSVARDGTIILPRIETPIVAICKTERELASKIAALYKEDYLKNPFVNVRALEQRSQPFAVIGAVNKPGSFYLNRRVRLLELLALAGGPDYEKSGSKVQIARVGSLSACSVNGGEDSADDVEFFSYSLAAVLTGDMNPMMHPGDIVSLIEAEEAYIVGNVDEPTTIKLKEPTTLTQAIAKAGGLGAVANTSKVVIQRREPGSKVPKELIFDLKEIRDQKVEDPLLVANDIVEVPTSNTKVIRNGLLKVLTGGISNLFYRFPI
ncbi:MAG: SLBB domain-containing protein [Pyrinomonadaceae bacterium]